MAEILVVSVGNLAKSPYIEQIREYAKRTKWKLSFVESPVSKFTTPDEIKRDDAKKSLAKIPEGSFVILLDERGKNPESVEFAGLISQKMAAHKSVCFVVGGAYGHADELRNRADYALSLGKMTMPHEMAMLVLTEQLYRAYTICNNHPYHKD